VVYQLDAALAGFKPSAWRLQQLLAQVSRPPRGPGERPQPYAARAYVAPANAGPVDAVPVNAPARPDAERDYR
jgi:hypothetical protein